MKTTIPFDVTKARQGATVVTRDGYKVKIYDYDCGDNNYPIVGFIFVDKATILPQKWKEDGTASPSQIDKSTENNDLFIIEESAEVNTRRMTHQELAWWLRDHPEEHRELKMSVDDPIIDSLYYYDNETNVTVNKDIIIRRNGGEWEEPIVDNVFV